MYKCCCLLHKDPNIFQKVLVRHCLKARLSFPLLATTCRSTSPEATAKSSARPFWHQPDCLGQTQPSSLELSCMLQCTRLSGQAFMGVWLPSNVTNGCSRVGHETHSTQNDSTFPFHVQHDLQEQAGEGRLYCPTPPLTLYRLILQSMAASIATGPPLFCFMALTAPAWSFGGCCP